MAFYESVVIARPELTETQIDKLINDLSEIIKETLPNTIYLSITSILIAITSFFIFIISSALAC